MHTGILGCESRDENLRDGSCGQRTDPLDGQQYTVGAAAPDRIPPDCEQIVPQMLPLLALSQSQIDAIVQTVPGAARNVQDIYPLSPLQEGMLFHHLLSDRNDTYVLSSMFSCQSRAHVDALLGAIQKVIDRHDVLRTALVWEKVPRPVQVVYRTAQLAVQELTLDPQRDAIEQLKERMRPGAQQIDVRRAPLMRAQVSTHSCNGQWYVLLHVHHIACDHQSLRTVLEEVMTCVEGRERVLSTPVPYRDYVTQVLNEVSARDPEAFFRKKLQDVDEPTAPFALLDVHAHGNRIEEACEALDEALARQVRVRAKAAGVSPARLFHAAWSLVVARTCGRDDVVFGTVILTARQRGSHARRMLGLTVNTLPLRLQLRDMTARLLVKQTHQELLDLASYDCAPLALTQRCSAIAGSAPLFTSLLNYRHSAAKAEADRPDTLGVSVLARGEAWTNYPITMTVDDLGQGFVLMAKTDERLEPQRMLAYLRTALQSLSHALEHAPDTPAWALPVLPPTEQVQILHQFNDTRTAYSEHKLIHQLFEERARHEPDAVAVVAAGTSVMYGELNQRANQLARHLRPRGVGPDRLVAICLERSVEALVALFGVLKAGGAYIPLDPATPVERLEHILADAAPGVLVTRQGLRSAFERTVHEIVAIDTDWDSIASQPTHDLDPQALQLTSRNLAYVIYTSGSTGKPKGVMIEHRSIVNYATYAIRRFDVAAGNGSLVCTSFSFDLMLTGLYPTLLSGRTVRLCREQQGLPALVEELRDLTDLAPLKLTPSHLGLLERALRNDELRGRVRTLVLGGEALPADTIRLWRKHAPGTRIFNHYGPTEAAVGCVVHELDEDIEDAVPIGRPIANTRIYILDEHRQIVPIGVVGEIFVGGAGVARGYLHRPELTAERFVSDPFSSQPQARMYRTGDLGRWRPDGTIEYLGRNDDQVKIRGFRVELGEIEANLLRHENVRRAAVMLREDDPGEKRLVAYVVPSQQPGPPETVLHAHLSSVLPDYMIPAAFVFVDRLPLTSNGKLDRRALPAPDPGAYRGRRGNRYEPPQDEVESILARIWASLLRVDAVGREDNFFELGGHSLLIVEMLERMRQVGLSADVPRIFNSRTLAELASTLIAGDAGEPEVAPNLIPAGCTAITPQMLTLVKLDEEHIATIVQAVPGAAANIQDVYPLAPLQEGILFHYSMLKQGAGDMYVVPAVLSMASRRRLGELIAALQATIDRHDILRTAVLWEKLPEPVQVVYRRALLPVEEIQLDPQGDPLEQILAWTRPEQLLLDPRRAPLMRLQVATDHSGRWYAVLKAHHLALDHVALEVMISEVVARLDGRTEALPEVAPYREHVARALAYSRKQDAEAFFRNTLADVDEPTAPFDLFDVYGDGSSITEAQQMVEPSLAARIQAQARSLGVSAATIFHAAWALVIGYTSGRDDVVFGTVLLGRIGSGAGTHRTLGVFINTLPIRLRLRDVDARQLIELTQRELVGLLTHDQTSLSVAQRCSGLSAAIPLFTSLFNYRHSTASLDAQWSSARGIEAIAVQGRTNYPITLSTDELPEGFRLTAQTDRRIDPRCLLAYLTTALRSLIDALGQARQSPVLALQVLPESELHQIVHSFNSTQAVYAREKLVHELFEGQARKTPDTVAVQYEDRSLTYAGLNHQANQLARHLRAQGVGAEHPVAICMERSTQMLVAVLAVLKAGAAYLPIDPNYPAERIQYMLEDAAPRILLTQQALLSSLPGTRTCVIALDERLSLLEGYSAEDNPPARIGLVPQSLVYVIYTSGSTGKPKGTAMTHGSMVNLLQWQQRSLPLGRGQRVLQFAALSFDVAFQEMLSTLCAGGTLMLVDEWVRKDARALADFLHRRCIERLFVPPLMLQALAEYFSGGRDDLPQHLQDVIVAGEQLRISPEITRLFARIPGCRLHNHYGPTETHVVTSLTLQGDPQQWPVIPSIGTPVSNTRIHLLNRFGQPVPVGVVGEIYICGDNVARGYLNRPELSAQRFIADPFSADRNARMYRTGDLGRWRDDGTLQYLGRNDSQVKIRGFRIELGEIEAQISRYEEVSEAVVVACEGPGGVKHLAAYLTLHEQTSLDADWLRADLGRALPDYMVPSAIVILPSLPLTPNGKLDRRALPAPQLGVGTDQHYEPPQGDIEAAVARIWQELLGIEQIGRRDDFFDLGGHSLLATRVITHVSHELDVDLSVRLLFDRPTIEGLSEAIAQQMANSEPVEA
jgi:amino acid adenylation domain-containing protein